jgi:2'-hydroxyisoflavone reductase
MTTSRRKFLKQTASGALVLGLGQDVLAGEHTVPRAETSLRILILGGTTYLGPYQIKRALERGHEVTIFNRGRTVPTLFPEVFSKVEKLRGDRSGDLESLKGREWDAVIDNSATDPKWVRDAALLLKDSVGLYLFTSSTGVYYPYLAPAIDESTEVVTEHGPATGGADAYGVNKSLSEIEAREAFPDRAIIVRPHYIIGPGDPKDRLTYWVVRIDVGGEVLAPGDRDDPVQLIDVRDLTEWMIRLVENGDAGTYNATGPGSRLSSAEFVAGIRAITASEVSFTWVGTDFLVEHELPYMVPWVAPRGDMLGMSNISPARAIAKGLTYRPLAVTAYDNLKWWKGQPEERRAPLSDLPRQREKDALAAWHAREA